MANFRITITDLSAGGVVAEHVVTSAALIASLEQHGAPKQTIGWYKHNGIARGLRWTHGTRRVDVRKES